MQEDATFIAEACTLLPKALSEIERLNNQILLNCAEEEKVFEAWRQKVNYAAKEARELRTELAAAQALCAKYREALELIAMSKRSDGTYNRCREACEILAKEALAKANEILV